VRVSSDAWQQCAQDGAWLAEIEKGGEGSFDSELPRYYATFSQPGTNPPLLNASVRDWNDFPAWTDLYTELSMPACFGALIDELSVGSALSAHDLCELKLKSVKGCAPGWSTDLIEFSICQPFSQCVQDLTDSEAKWKSVKASRVQGDDFMWKLPVGWDDLDAALAVLRSEALAAVTKRLLTDRHSWAAFNIPVAGILGAGCLLMVVAIIAGFRRPAASSSGMGVLRQPFSAEQSMGDIRKDIWD
jgi:hypothetical protein